MQGIKGFPQIIAGLSVLLVAGTVGMYMAGSRRDAQAEAYSTAVEQRESSAEFSQAAQQAFRNEDPRENEEQLLREQEQRQYEAGMMNQHEVR